MEKRSSSVGNLTGSRASTLEVVESTLIILEVTSHIRSTLISNNLLVEHRSSGLGTSDTNLNNRILYVRAVNNSYTRSVNIRTNIVYTHFILGNSVYTVDGCRNSRRIVPNTSII